MSKTVIVILSVVGTLVAGGIALAVWGVSLFSGETCDHLKKSAAVVQRLGAIGSCQIDYTASGGVHESDTFVFDLRGDKGRGKAFVNSTSDGPGGAEVFHSIVLEVGGDRVVVEGEPPATH